MTSQGAASTLTAMRSVDELAALQFQDYAGMWCRYEYNVAAAGTEFTLQLAVRSIDGATWEQLEAYIGHPSTHEQLWWTFDVNGYETNSGGNPYDLFGPAGVPPEETDEVLRTVREAATTAVHSVTSALAY